MEREQVAAAKARISLETPFAVAVFRKIYAAQKPDERRLKQHIGHDGRGFQELETPFLCRLYERLDKRGWKLTADEADLIRKRMEKYAAQYIALNREATERVREEIQGAPRSETSKPDKPAARRSERQGERRSAYRDVRAGTSPKVDEDDEFAFLMAMPLEKRVAALDKMADRMGV